MYLNQILINKTQFEECLISKGYWGYISPADYSTVFQSETNIQEYAKACNQCKNSVWLSYPSIAENSVIDIPEPETVSYSSLSDTDVSTVLGELHGVVTSQLYVSDEDLFVRSIPVTNNITKPVYNCYNDCVRGTGGFSNSRGGCVSICVTADAACRGSLNENMERLCEDPSYRAWNLSDCLALEKCLEDANKTCSGCYARCSAACKKWKTYPFGGEASGGDPTKYPGTVPGISLISTDSSAESTENSGTVSKITADTVSRGKQVCPVVMWINQTPEVDDTVKYDAYGRAINYY